jgi:hypothetical protein
MRSPTLYYDGDPIRMVISRERKIIAAVALAVGVAAVGLAWTRSPPPGPTGAASASAEATEAPLETATASEVGRAPTPPTGATATTSGRPVDVARELIRLQFDWDHSPDARDRVLADAVRIGGPEIVRWLAQLAMTDPAGARAATALGTIADPRAAAQLLRLARSDASPLVRANAVRALGASGGRADAVALAALVEDPAQPARVREEAADAIARIGERSR